MQISRNADWQTAAKRLDAFWHREILDRPCIQITTSAPQEDRDAVSPPPGGFDPEARWNDPAVMFNIFRSSYMWWRCLGEALPVMYPNWEGLSKMLGCTVKYDQNTMWVIPGAESVLDLDLDQLDIAHPEVKSLLERLSYCAEHGKGDAFIGLPPLGNAGDTLAKICGYENLCVDLIEHPDAVMQAEKKLTAFWKALYDEVFQTINQHMQGSCGWLPAWYSGRSALIEFDLASMISPEMFKMYLPELLERAEHVEHSIYHLDGPDALVHLDTILAQKEFDAIQWEPGIGCKDILEWLPVMQKIQAAGKGLYVANIRYSKETVLELLKNLRPEGLMIPILLPSVQEGEAFLETVAKMF